MKEYIKTQDVLDNIDYRIKQGIDTVKLQNKIRKELKQKQILGIILHEIYRIQEFKHFKKFIINKLANEQ